MQVCPQCFSLYGPDQKACNKDQTETKHYTEVLVGLHLGPYVVRSLVSEGGMGVVYAGEHPVLRRRVALKVLRPELSLRDDIVERFAQEARAVNTIGHANIVNIYDFGKTPFGTFYIVMEYIEGRTVRHLIDTAGAQPLERIRHVLEGVGNALDAAHTKGFIHRDVKPENIMVGQRGAGEYIKLLDFGIAKLLTGGATTATSSAMGTAQYMSPEQLDDTRLDHRTDVYSMGAVLYEMLTGLVPFPGAAQAAVRQAQLTTRPPAPGLVRKDIHLARSLDVAVLRAIEMDPAARHQSITELLESYRGGHNDSIAEQSAGIRRPQKKRSIRVFAISGILAAILGVGIAATILFATRDSGQVAIAPQADATPTRAAPAKLSRADARAKALSVVDRAFLGKRRRMVTLFAKIVRPEAMRPLLHKVLKTKGGRGAAEVLAGLPTSPATVAALEDAARDALSFFKVAVGSALLQHTRTQLGTVLLESALRRAKNPLLQRGALVALVPVRPKLVKRLKLLASGLPWGDGENIDMADVLAAVVRARPGKKSSRRALAALENAMRRGESAKKRIRAAEVYWLLPKGVGATPAKVTLAMQATVKGVSGRLLARSLGLLAIAGDAKAAKSLLKLVRSADEATQTWAILQLGRLRRLERMAALDGEIVHDELVRSLLKKGDVELAAAVALLAF